MLRERRQQWVHAVMVVCMERVGVNSIRFTTCSYWVIGRCSGMQGSLARVAQF